MLSVDVIVDLFSKYHIRFNDEKALQFHIAKLLTDNGIKFEREFRLDGENILDFLLDEGITIECKIKGSNVNLIRQLMRYSKDERVKSIIVVTNLYRLTNIPNIMHNKPVQVFVFSVL